MLGDMNIVFWTGGLVMLGALGLFVGSLVLIFRIFAWVMRGIFGESAPLTPPALPGQAALCPHSNCRAPNPDGARYCGRCGRALRRGMDSYG